jgi:DNA replication licensing factor MCM2
MFSSDYGTNDALDKYSDSGIDDAQEFEAVTADQRRAAERAMAQRDLRDRGSRRGARAAVRSRGPDFLLSDGLEEDGDLDGGLLSGMKRRTRRQYDERRDIDDMDGVEDVGLAATPVGIFV